MLDHHIDPPPEEDVPPHTAWIEAYDTFRAAKGLLDDLRDEEIIFGEMADLLQRLCDAILKTLQDYEDVAVEVEAIRQADERRRQ